MRQGDSEGERQAGARQDGVDRTSRRVTVIGFDGQPPTSAVRAALAEATLVIGNIRHLDLLPVPENARRMAGLGMRDFRRDQFEKVVFLQHGVPGELVE